MRYLSDEKPSLDDLAHYGVKGMKWGVRKAYTDRVSKSVATYDRVAKGTASKREKIGTTLQVSGTDIVRGRGLKGAAARIRDREQAHLDRLNSGERKARDVIKMVGNVNVADIAQGMKNAREKK